MHDQTGDIFREWMATMLMRGLVGACGLFFAYAVSTYAVDVYQGYQVSKEAPAALDTMARNLGDKDLSDYNVSEYGSKLVISPKRVGSVGNAFATVCVLDNETATYRVETGRFSEQGFRLNEFRSLPEARRLTAALEDIRFCDFASTRL